MTRRGLIVAAVMVAVAWAIVGAEAAPAAEGDKPAATTQPAAPPNTLTDKEKADGFVLLFDGKSLEGWKAAEKPESFKVADGKIIAHGQRAHLFYVGPVAEGNFQSFEFRAKVLIHPKSNSGIYIHTKYQEKGWPSAGYECQVCSNAYKDPRKTGSIYKYDDVKESPVKDGEWFDYTILVDGRKITTLLNGKKAAEYTDSDDPAKAKLKGGTFALQGHDPGSTVEYHTLRVRVLPAGQK